MSPYVEDAVRFIETSRSLSRPVLVHSYGGRSRAPSLILHYLMLERNMNLSTAHDRLLKRWNHVIIHPSFLSELVKLDDVLQPRRKSVSIGTDVNYITRRHGDLHDSGIFGTTTSTPVRKNSINAWT